MDQNMCSKLNGPPSCGKCSKHIFDGTILQAHGQYWHNACLQCVICLKPLTGSCHVKDNSFYCRTDFIRSFGAKCTECSEVISPTERVHVINEQIYHATCFTCSMCSCQLYPGSHVYVRDNGRLLCSNDYQTWLEMAQDEPDSESDESGSDDTDPTFNIRTIHDNQLCMLVNAYDENRRPNKQARKQLADQTGLKTRTIQIWFKNKRGKDRSIERKQSQFNDGQLYNDNNSCRHQPSCGIINQQQNNFQQNGGNNQRGVTGYNQKQPMPQNKNDNNNLYPEMYFENYELFCPLDYLLPNEMPPNVDLSSADICDGEVISGKHHTGNSKNQIPQPEVNSCRSWLAL